jgi:hypothetical protein
MRGQRKPPWGDRAAARTVTTSSFGPEDSNAPAVPVTCVEGGRDDGAGVHPRDDQAGPCQEFARNSAARGPTTPHDTLLHSASHLRGRAGTRGTARRREPPARRWHARGQGSNSPQLHPRSEALVRLDRPRIGRLAPQIRSNRPFARCRPAVQDSGDAGSSSASPAGRTYPYSCWRALRST